MNTKKIEEEIERIHEIFYNGSDKKLIGSKVKSIQTKPILESGFVRLSLEAAEYFGESSRQLLQLRKIGKIKNNNELRLNLYKQIDALGDSIDDATKKRLKSIADEIGNSRRANLDNAFNKYLDEIEPSKLKIDLSKSTISIQKILDQITELKNQLAKFKDEYKIKLEEAYFSKLETYLGSNTWITSSYPTIDDFIDASRIQLETYLKREIPGQTNEFYDFYTKYISDKINDFEPLRSLYRVDNPQITRPKPGITGQVEVLPDALTESYRRIVRKIRTSGANSVTDSEKQFVDAVDDWMSGGVNNLEALEILHTALRPKGIEDLIEFKATPFYKKWSRYVGDVFLTNFYPYFRQWSDSISQVLLTQKNSMDNFEQTFTQRFKEYLEKGTGDVNKGSIYDLVYSLERAPRDMTKSEIENITGNLYKRIYDDFVSKGIAHFEGQTIVVNGQTKNLTDEFKNFCTKLENYSDSHWLLKDKKFAGLNELFSDIGDSKSMGLWDGTKKSWQEFQRKLTKFDSIEGLSDIFVFILQKIQSLAGYVWTFWRGGSFVSPAQYQRYITQYYKQQGKFLSPRWVGWKYLITRGAISFVIIPAIYGVIDFIWDGIFGNLMGAGKDDSYGYIFSDNENNMKRLVNYIAYSIMHNQRVGLTRDLLNKLSLNGAARGSEFGEDSLGKSSWEFYIADALSLLPGSSEDLISWAMLNLSNLKGGDKTKEEVAVEEAKNLVSEKSKEAFDSHDNTLKSEGEELKTSLGENPNSENWRKFWDKEMNSDLKLLFHPDLGLPYDGDVIGMGSSKQLIKYFEKNKELVFGLNPGYIGFYASKDINKTKMRAIGNLKKYINDPTSAFDFGVQMRENLEKFIQKENKGLGQTTQKESPFVVIKSGDKKYILKHNASLSYSDPNFIQFYYPDYKTLYDALVDPTKMVVPNDYKITQEEEKNGVKESNLVRLQLLPLNKITNYITMSENIINRFKRIIKEEAEKENFKMKDWDEIFTFQKIDPKTPGQFKDVEIKMRDVMDRIEHWRKRYKKECEENDEKGDKGCDDGEDDSFVRAVIDTHPDVVRVLFTKGLAKLTTSDEKQKLEEGFAMLLRLIREERNAEVEVWSVYRHKSSPDKIWSLVKGDFKQSEMESMGVGMQQPPKNSVEKQEDTLTSLKKKEHKAIESLKINEKNGFDDLPRKLREKLNDKFNEGWTTEVPKKNLYNFYEKKTLSSAFNGDVEIYKVKSPEKFFSNLESNSSDITISRGFCKTMAHAKKGQSLSSNQKRVFDHFVNKCNDKFEGNYSGLRYLSKK